VEETWVKTQAGLEMREWLARTALSSWCGMEEDSCEQMRAWWSRSGLRIKDLLRATPSLSSMRLMRMMVMVVMTPEVDLHQLKKGIFTTMLMETGGLSVAEAVVPAAPSILDKRALGLLTKGE
jgi:hypothetical protein